jgi:flagellar capping protein FliD
MFGNNINRIRLSGMNSGLDTEALVRAMSGATMLRINNNRRNVLRLQAQQTAYRDVISKLQNFQQTYFNVLNRNNFLRSPTLFNRTSASVFTTINDVETKTTPPGVTVSTAGGAAAGTYNVELLARATQTTLVSSEFGSNIGLDMNVFNGAVEGENFAFSIRVGNINRNVVVDIRAGDVGNPEQAVNRALREAYGTANDGQGIVRIDADGKVTSTNRNPISLTSVVKMTPSQGLQFNANPGGMTVGANSFNLQIGNELRVIDFNTIDAARFQHLTFVDTDGVFGNAGDTVNLATLTPAQREQAIDLITEAQFIAARDTAFAAWEGSAQDNPLSRTAMWENAYRIASGGNPPNAADVADWIASEGWDVDADIHEAFNIQYGAGTITRVSFVRLGVADRVNDAVREYDAAARRAFDTATRADYDAWAAGSDPLTDPVRMAMFERSYFDRVYVQGNRGDYNTWDAFLASGDPALGGITTVDELIAAWEDADGPVRTAFNAFIAGDSRFPSSMTSYVGRAAFRANSYNELHAWQEHSASGSISFNGFKNTFSIADAVVNTNQHNLKSAVERQTFANGVRAEVTFNAGNTNATITANPPATPPAGFVMPQVAVTLNEDSSNNFGISTVFTVEAATVDTNSTLAMLNLDDSMTFNANGEATIRINNVNITIRQTMTVGEMMTAVTNSQAGVTMTYSALTNRFTLTSKESGADGQINVQSDEGGIFDRLGLGATVRNSTAIPADPSNPSVVPNPTGVTQGRNLSLNVNGNVVETSGNSFTIDGTTFTFANHVEVGTKFRVEVGGDKSVAAEAIKNFVRDYNALIDDIFGMLNERPNRAFHFLTEHDIEEGRLSDREIDRWEAQAKRGLLSRNSTITGIMGQLRNAITVGVPSANGGSMAGGVRVFTVFDIRGNDSGTTRGVAGLRPTNDFRQNGRLDFDEEAFMEALERNPEDIIALFTSENGIMANIERVLDNAISTRLDDNGNARGSLVRRAGLETGLFSTKNALHTRIESLNSAFSTLQMRFDRQQDRYWKMFTAMEKQFAALNSQSNHMAGMFNNMWGN